MKRAIMIMLLGVLTSYCVFIVAGEPGSTGWTGEQPAVTAVTYDPAATPASASRSFKAAVVKAAEQAYKDGEISRWDLAKIRLCPAKRLAEAQACVVDDAVKAGLMKPADVQNVGAFDWSKLLSFIQQLLPLILSIISIFG